MINLKNILALTLFALSASTALAFPEMIKHGYTNCTACHISPSGGGLLNQYGRSISSELLSSWSVKGEEGFLHGAVDTSAVNDWLAVGGDYRGVDVKTTSVNKKSGVSSSFDRYINMQIGLEFGIVQPKWAVIAYLGQFFVGNYSEPNRIIADVNRFYALYKPSDELMFKVGRFQPNFGINLPEHNLSTRTRLELGSLSYRGGKISIEDKNTAEVFWLGETYAFSGAVYKVRDDVTSNNDQGLTLTASRFFGETFKFGPQFLTEKSDVREKNIFGLNASLGWNSKIVTLLEADQVEIKPKVGQKTTGVAMIHRTSYEAFKGFNLALLNDYYQSDMKIGTSIVYRYGPGVMWYPRPHLDFQVFYTKEERSDISSGDYAWLMSHYYF